MSVRVISWVLEKSPVQRWSDLLVLLVLAEHASDDGTDAYPARATIARKARMSERNVKKVLRRLQGEGHIRSEGPAPMGRPDRRPNNYTILLRGERGGPPQNGGNAGTPRRSRGERRGHHEGNRGTPEPSQEPSSYPPISPLSGGIVSEDGEVW